MRSLKIVGLEAATGRYRKFSHARCRRANLWGRMGTISCRFRKTPPTLQRGGARTSGETDDAALAVWWDDVLGPRRTTQRTIMKTFETILSGA